MHDVKLPGYACGFEPAQGEFAFERLELRGRLPAWLRGSFYKTGPGSFAAGDTLLAHQFDGPAYLQRFAMANGEVNYRSRWLAPATGRDGKRYPSFGTAVPLARRQEIEAEVEAGAAPHVNANVAFAQVGGELCAVTDGSQFPLRFDPESLAARGPIRFEDTLSRATCDGEPAPGLRRATTAHYQVEPEGSLLNYFVQFGPKPSYNFFRIAPGSTRREPLGILPTDMPSLVHAFNVTERYIVFPEFPLVCDQRRLAAGEAYGRTLDWREGRATKIHLIDRHTGARERSFEVEPMYVMHTANAYERDGEVVFDVAAYADGTHVRELYLDPSLRPPGGAFAGQRVAELRNHARMRRYRLPLDGGPASWQPLSPVTAEFPTFDCERRNGRDYGVLYCSGLRDDSPDSRYYNQIARIDLVSGETCSWWREGHYVGEPIFVRRPGSTGESDGVLLASALDAPARRSYLLMLDAATLGEVASASLPFAMPFSFHGAFLAS